MTRKGFHKIPDRQDPEEKKKKNFDFYLFFIKMATWDCQRQENPFLIDNQSVVLLRPKNPNNMDSKAIKNNIRKIREDLHLTQQEMAEKLNISRTAFRQLESGSTRLYSHYITDIANLVGCTEEECLLGYVPNENPDPVVCEQSFEIEKLTARNFDLEKEVNLLRDYNRILEQSNRTLENINNHLANELRKYA